MKKLLMLALFFSAFSAFAASSVECITTNSKNLKYTLVLSDFEGKVVANYAINGQFNQGADVSVGSLYYSDRILAFSLTVDYVENKFEVVASRLSDGMYVGKLFVDGKQLNVNCLPN